MQVAPRRLRGAWRPVRPVVVSAPPARPVLGSDVAAGERPQVVVAAGTWQATVTRGSWSLLGTVVVPPYTDDCVEFASPETLAAQYPEAAVDLRALPG